MSLGKKLFIGSSAGGACPTDSVQPFGVDSAYSSNVALYQLDGNANDTVGNHNGTATNITYSTGKYGNAAVFNGSSSYIEIPNLIGTNINFSASFWVNGTDMNKNTSDPSLIETFFYNRNPYIVISQHNGNWQYTIKNSSSQNTSISYATSNFNDNQWYHFVITCSGLGGQMNLYIDGTNVGTNTAPTSILNVASTGLIGAGGTASQVFDGKLDQVRIYDKAISSDEVSILYNETASTASNTNVLGEGSGVALYSLDYDASDASGNYNGSANSNVTFGVEGRINTAADFTGGGVVTIPNDVIYGNNHSVSVWFKLDNTSGYQGLFDFDYNNRIIFRVASSDANEALVGTSGWFAHNINFSVNQWYHLVITFSNGNPFKIYVNGSIAYTGGNSSLNAQFGDNNFGAGNAAGVHSVNGNIDQLRIFKKELSATEVSTLYAETACVYTSTTDQVDYQGTNLAYYKFDNTALDETGNYDGTESNITYEFGRYGQAAVFNGTSSYISLTDIPSTASADISISAWINADTLSGDRTIISLRKNRLIEITINSGYSAGQRLEFKFYDGVSNKVINLNENLITVGNWHHICLTAQAGGNMIAYFDGVAQGSPLAIGNVYVANQSDTIGAYISGAGGFFDGKIDQVRIYGLLLDATAVENLYNEKQEINTSNFEPVLYEGNGGSQYISNVGFEPDLVWIKSRGINYDHQLHDSVRGAGNGLLSNSNVASVFYNTVTSFDSNGFFVNAPGTYVGTNANNQDFVAWCWKAGGDAVNNTNGNITSQVSANQDAGFSIVKWISTGSNTSTKTVGHGLSSTPEMIILKNVSSSTASWRVYHNNIPSPNNSLALNSAESAFSFWPSVSSTNFGLAASVTTGESSGASGQSIIAYCFHSVAGYQRAGSYVGNNPTSSTVRDITGLGFTPRFVLLKNASTLGPSWNMYDSVRPNGFTLLANSTNAEANYSTLFEIITDGFRLKSVNTNTNYSTDTFIYLAIA